MNIAIVDDELSSRESFEKILRKCSNKLHFKMDLKSFSNGNSFLDDFHPLLYTVVFLDIYMNGLSGIEIAKEIRKVDSDVLIVFLTESDEFMPEAFSIHAFHYIIKPSSEEALYDKAESLLMDILNLGTGNESIFQFISQRKEYRLPYQDIVYIESNGHYCYINDKDKKRYKYRSSFSEVFDFLESDPRFLTINRGILINMDYLNHFEERNVVLYDNTRLPISVRNSKKIFQIIQNYTFSKLRHEIRYSGEKNDS